MRVHTFYILCSVFDMLSDHLDSHLQRIKKQFNIVKSFLIRIPTSKVSWACTANIYSVKYKVSLYPNFPYTSAALLAIIEYYFYCTLTAYNCSSMLSSKNFEKNNYLYNFMLLVPYICKIYALDDRFLCLLEVCTEES